MKPTNRVAVKHNLGDKSSQSQKPSPAEVAAQPVSTPAGKTCTIGVWLPLEIWEIVDFLAKALGLSKADIVRWSIYYKMLKAGVPRAKSVLGITARHLAKPAVAARIRALTMTANSCEPARAGKGGAK